MSHNQTSREGLGAMLVCSLCNKLRLIIERETQATDVNKPAFNDYQDGGLVEHTVELKSTMGNIIRVT